MKILIVGISVRAMVESAVNSRCDVLALDAFGDRDLKSLANSYSLHHDFNARFSAEELLKASRQLSYDAVAYTSNLENHPAILRRIAGGRPIIGNSPESIAAVRNWKKLFVSLRHAGFSVPEFILADDARIADESRRWLIKPLLSGGGHGITFAQNGQKADGQSMLQEYVEGKSCSASFIADGRECVIIGVAQQLAGIHQFGSKGFRYCGNILPLPEMLIPEKRRLILEQIRKLAGFLTRKYGLAGVNGIDFILDGGRVWLTEVNPRYSASMELIERAYELPVFYLHAQAALDRRLSGFSLETACERGGFFGKAILFAERDVIAPDMQGWIDKTLRDVPASGEILHKGSPVCTILTSGQSYHETLGSLLGRTANLKDEIYAAK
jgi:uncharacterized protein